MRVRAILLLCAVIVVSFIVIYVIPVWNSSKVNSQQNGQSLEQNRNSGEQQNSRRSEWTLNADYGVELWIAWKEVRHPDFGLDLTIFAFMEDKYFNEETLRKLFTSMAEQYSQYAVLSIDIYSDEEELAWHINDFRFNGMNELPKPPQPAEERKPKDHFFAGYFRITWPNGLQEERFSYTPDPTKRDLIKIKLKP